MLLGRKQIDAVWLIIFCTGICSSTETVFMSDLKDVYNFEKSLFSSFDYISSNWFTKAKLIVLLYSKNVQLNYFVSRLHGLTENKATSLLTLNTNIENPTSQNNSKIHTTENDVIVYFLEELDNILVTLESNHVFHFNKRSQMVVFHIQIPVTGTKLITEEILPASCGKSVLMLAVVHVRLNIDSKVNQCEYDISVVSYNPFLGEYYSRQVTFDTFGEAKEILRYAYSRSKLSNLQGHSLRVATHCVNVEPVFTLNKIEGKLSRSGFLNKGFDELNKRMNFTAEFVVVYERINFGNKLPNGTWTGIVGDLVNKRIEIGYTPLLENYDRNNVIQFSEHIAITHFSIVLPKAKQIPPWILLMLIFEYSVVLYIFGSLVVMVVAFKLTYNFFKISQDWSLIALDTFRILTSSSITQPNQHLVRALYITWVYFSLVVSSLYSQSIVSVLTIPRHYPDINTFKEFVNSKLPLNGWAYSKLIFKDEYNPLMWSIYKRFKIEMNYAKSLKSIKDGIQIALIHTKNTLDYSVVKARTCPICSDPFHYMRESFGMQIQAIALTKGSPYILRVNELIIAMRESGLFDKWNSKMLYQLELKTACFSHCSVNKVLSVWDLQICFYILLAGTFVSLVLFCIENTYNSFRSCKKVSYLNK